MFTYRHFSINLADALGVKGVQGFTVPNPSYTASDICSGIWQVVGFRQFKDFQVGVTDAPIARRMAHGNPNEWYQWLAKSEGEARSIESQFLRLGMQGGSGGGGSASYVYTFYKPENPMTSLLGALIK